MSNVKLKVLAVSGSPRKESTTDIIIKVLLAGAEEAGHSTEFIKLNELDLTPCQACGFCREAPQNWCKLEDEGSLLLEKTRECDVLVFGSPVYMGGVSAQAKAYLDRWYSFKDSNKITKLDRDRRAIGVYAQGAREGTYYRLFETNERLFNSNNFAYLGTLVATDYKVPAEGDPLLKRAWTIGNSL
jgi:multimeric flavodoxin WrbA